MTVGDVRFAGVIGFRSVLASDHATGYKNYVREIHAVLTLNAVERLLFRN